MFVLWPVWERNPVLMVRPLVKFVVMHALASDIETEKYWR